MRMAFGLAGLLIVLGVIVVVMHQSTLPAAKQAIHAKKDAEEKFGGLSSGGQQDAKDSIVLDPITAGGRFDGLVVRDVVAGGPMEARYGLRKEDTIVGANGMKLSDLANNDSGMAEALVLEAYGKNQALTVVRNGQRVELPQAGRPGAAKKAGGGGGGPLGPLQGKVRTPE